ncbi:MAG: hypothetical protein EOO77_20085 [Oxalobacteraceae bacterium]|nr:MAG: hypothetical protein EOO77_20085 [Oxalobacteraceae bacterium]
MRWPRIERHGWAVDFWGENCVLEVRLCRSWDGRFIVDKGEPALPLWGFRREHNKFKHDQETLRPRTRVMDGWRLWWPYVMIWYIKNTVDRIEIIIPGEDSTLH